MNEATMVNEWKNILWVIRIYALIIIAVLVISDVTAWLSEDTVTLIIMLMALFTITQSFQPYLAAHEKTRMWMIVGLIVLLVLGIIVFFLVQ